MNSTMKQEIWLEARSSFLGSIVVCRGEDGTYKLIDGQQRMTTIFLVFLCNPGYSYRTGTAAARCFKKQNFCCQHGS